MLDTETLESMCDLIVDCPHSTPKWTDKGYLVLRNQNIKGGVLDISTPSFTNNEDFQKRIKRAIPQEGDIVFTREAPMGEVCMIPKGLTCCLGQRQVLLRPKKDVNGQYLFWALQSQFVQHQISWNEGTGSTVSNVRIPVLKALNIPRHLEHEDDIAEILSSLAEKIELNRQTNKTLEEMAQAIFKSWFVDFEPVRAKVIIREKGGDDFAQSLAAQAIIAGTVTLEQLENMESHPLGWNDVLHPLVVKNFEPMGLDYWEPEQLEKLSNLFPNNLVESELGEIPEGWEVQCLSQMVELIGGGTPKKSEVDYWGGDIPWFSVKDAPVAGNVFVINTELKITELGLNKSSTKLLPEGVTIISARGTVGRLALVGIPTAMNQSCYGVKGINGIGPCLNYFYLKEAVSTLQQNTHGAVFDTITRDTFDSVVLVESSPELKEAFAQLVQPIFDHIKNNLFEVNNLSELRDVLLPKLLSGEISIEPTLKHLY